MEEFGANLKAAREKAGVTRKQMCIDLNLTTAALGQYERGIRDPDLKKLRDMAAYLQVSIDSLLGYDPTVTAGIDTYIERLRSYGYSVSQPSPGKILVMIPVDNGTGTFKVEFSNKDFLEGMHWAEKQARTCIDPLITERFRQMAITVLFSQVAYDHTVDDNDGKR